MNSELIRVYSTAIRAVGYDGTTLRVQFVGGGIYNHRRVPLAIYEGLMRAPSKGAYYNDHIRGRYR